MQKIWRTVVLILLRMRRRRYFYLDSSSVANHVCLKNLRWFFKAIEILMLPELKKAIIKKILFPHPKEYTVKTFAEVKKIPQVNFHGPNICRKFQEDPTHGIGNRFLRRAAALKKPEEQYETILFCLVNDSPHTLIQVKHN